MTNINKLSVSLTKHGAHKVARLIAQFEIDEVLDNTWDTFEGIRIDRAQARKITSALSDGTLPGFWSEAKVLGTSTINRLVILSIVFSHHELIQIFKTSGTSHSRGQVFKSQLDQKPFSNLKNNFVELGFADSDDENQFTYNLSPITGDGAIAALVLEVLRHKLDAAQWSSTNDIVDECVSLGFHDVFAISEAEFRSWLTKNESSLSDQDILPERPDPAREMIKQFKFRSGHNLRSTDDVVRNGSGKTPRARLIHNALQNVLYQSLATKFGSSEVGTEVATGASVTSIDVVRQHGNQYVFYEIKTSPSLKKVIREAVPQLLEYAYWPNNERATELVIVSKNGPTPEATAYLKLFRERFSIPIYHETIEPSTGELSSRF